MPEIQVVAKESHKILSDTTGNTVKLNESSVVLVKVPKADIESITRQGTSAVI